MCYSYNLSPTVHDNYNGNNLGNQKNIGLCTFFSKSALKLSRVVWMVQGLTILEFLNYDVNQEFIWMIAVSMWHKHNVLSIE